MVVTMTVGVLLAFSGQGRGPVGMKGSVPVYNDLSLHPDSVSYRSIKYICTVLRYSRLPRNAAAVPSEGRIVADFVWRIAHWGSPFQKACLAAAPRCCEAPAHVACVAVVLTELLRVRSPTAVVCPLVWGAMLLY